MVMAVISVGILCTELTETALAVLIQTAWWFISLMTGGTSMYGGNYGWNLIPRHNTELSSAGGGYCSLCRCSCRSRTGICEMEPAKYYFGTMAEVIAFGGLGTFAYAVSGNLIAGYMIPLGYYAAGISAGYKYMQKLYPFGMLTDYETKYWILAAGLVLMGCGIMLFRRRRCLQLH